MAAFPKNLSDPGRLSRLIFIAPSAYTLGGVQTWLDYVVEGLSAIGHQVAVGLVSGPHHDVAAYLKVHPFAAVEQIENPTGSAQGRIRGIERCLRKTKPDMVLSVNIADVYPAMARLKESGQRIRTVMTLHGIQADFFEDASRYRGVLDGVVCTNQLVKSLLRENGIEEARIQYAPYGVDYSPPHARRALPADRPIRIAYVGRYDEAQKRVRDIPIILKELEERKMPHALRLAGDGPLRDDLQAALAAQIGNGRAAFLGVLSPADVVRDVYQWADVLLVTSSWETGPIAIWEAMSQGVPVVTSAYVGSKAEASLVHGHNCLIFPVGDCRAAADSIVAIRASALRNTLVENGARLIVEKYSKPVSVKAWALAIEKLLHLPALPASPSPIPCPSGRLDRLLGVGLAESFRQLTGRKFKHQTAGGEWPHSHSSARTDDAFLLQASRAELQRVESP